MKLSARLESALNDQLALELESAYVYYGMAAYFEQTPFTGFASWMKLQSKEELGHAQKFFEYLTERNGKIVLKGISQPKVDYKAPLDAFKTSLAHEQKVSASICALYDLAHTEKEYATLSFLKWFLDEQVEEEKNVGDMVAKLELVGENHNGLYQIDQLAARRVAQAS